MHRKCEAASVATNTVNNTSAATNKPAASNPVATNTIEPATNIAVATNKTLNRRDRTAYNAYQREYMKKRRQAGKGNAAQP